MVFIAAALAVLFGAARVLDWLFNGAVPADFSGLAPVIVAGVIWYYYWYVSEKEGYPTPVARTARRWYLYVISGWGLIGLRRA